MDFTSQLTAAFFQNMGAPQILLILFLVLLLFGAKRLPELARGVGKALREFKSATRDIEDDIRTAFDDDEQKPAKKKEAPASDKNVDAGKSSSKEDVSSSA